MKTRTFSVVLWALSCSMAMAGPMAINLNQTRGELEVRFKEQKILVYAFAAEQFKPYVRELYTLHGENVLRDAPPDHLHHHGLMYAVWVNGTNFWEEKDAPGIEKPIEMLSQVTSQSEAGLPQAQFSQLIHWLPGSAKGTTNSAGAALLVEHRTLTVTVDEKSQEVALRWDADFEVGPKAGKVKLHGANYNGLGLRPALTLEQGARFENSESGAYTGNNTQNVLAARWTSLSGNIGSGKVLFVLNGHPSNAPGSARFFTMTRPFVYLAVTQGLDKNALEYSAGDKFRLRYLLTLYSSDKPTDLIQQRYERWIKEP